MVAAIGSSVHLTLSVSLVSDLLPPEQVRCALAGFFGVSTYPETL